ncbi:50S ribosomal protein L1 [Sulfodiicoccus acidiphilus]|uniref:Large ribosomal subunit protein uL1 n=1 Tax=Sulfodiicoccus acidiphilus TaxID=1670455 RepID=A0A348B307_9CREN|nr:50S ribosomal protein L1 [Sulfodiicoccus acidiphilus]BBD72559.1 50S ribosomal protein L1 [Sulfodiicoccus acidiphilus]GGT93661.1 50S ribosomal protein L1 [Sulfodiicoccus acidiphilus]
MIVTQEKLAEALSEALSEGLNPKRNFTQAVDVIVVFKDVNMKVGDVKLRETVFLPNRPSVERRVLVVPNFEQLENAKKAQPAVVMSKDELQKLQGNKRAVKKLASQNQWFLISQDNMALAGRVLGPALGPRGKFPVPMPNNLDPVEVISNYKRATLLRTKDQPHVQAFIGTVDLGPDKLAANALAVLNVVESKLKSQSNVKAIYVKTTMGKPVRVK